MLDLTAPVFFDDPFTVYRSLHRRGPLLRSEYGPWLVVSHSLVADLLKDDRLSVRFTDRARWEGSRGGPDSPAVAVMRRWPVFNDGPRHRELRRPISRSLTSCAVAGYEQLVEDVVEQTLAGLPAVGTVDFVAAVAEPIVITLMAGILGLPACHHDQFLAWTRQMIKMAEPLCSRADRAATARAIAELHRFLEGTQFAPGGIAATLLQRAAGPIGRQEALATVSGLLLAGVDTTAGQLSNAFAALTTHPEEHARLRENPASAQACIAEFTRFDPPVQIVSRIVTTDIPEVGPMRAGDTVMLVLGAAGRDPDRYPNPDHLDLTRTGIDNLAFGGGPHLCPGTRLAHRVLATALTAFIHRYPRAVPTDPAAIPWRHSVVSRRPLQLKVSLT